MQSAPLPADEINRLAALRNLQVLDTGPEPAFDRVVALAREVLRVPLAAVSLVDRDRQWFKAIGGFCVQQTPRDIALCAHAILRDEVMVIPDAACDARFADNPLVTGGPGVRFYAAAPIRLADGSAVGALCIVDHTPRTLTEAECGILRRLAEIAAEALQARVNTSQTRAEARAAAQFIAGLGQELRAPLTAILGFADLLDDEDIDADQQRDHLATIRRSGRHLLGMINDVLDFAAIESGTLSPEQRAFPVADLLTEVRRDIQPLAEEKGLHFDIEVDERAATALNSDPARVRQILTTLASAAVRLTDRGSVILRVHAAAEEDRVRFEIVDTSSGLTPDLTARRLAGVALGLQVSRHLARLLHGELRIASTPGVGDTFSVSLPAFRAETAAAQHVEIGGPDADGRPLARLRVLVVDDNIHAQRLLSLQLRQAGAAVSLSGSGGAAIDALTAGGAWPADAAALPRFDAVLLSLQLPGFDADATARTLRDLNHPAPVIALTAAATTEEARQSVESGCAAYLARPVDRAALLNTLRHVSAQAAAVAAAAA